MAIKVITNTPEEKPLTYPQLRTYHKDDLVVLFTEPKKGTVVKSSAHLNAEIGHYREDWVMSNTNPFEGSITLINS